jgi:cyclopropane-fatty-acyl-phospholipid synthase
MTESHAHRGLAPLAALDRLARHAVLHRLGTLTGGEITLREPGRATRLGEPNPLRAALQVHRSRFFRQAFFGGTLSVAESYLRGDWDCDDLTNLFRIFVRNRTAADRVAGPLARLAELAQRLYHGWRANTRAGARRNIAAHYDLGNDFFQLWLDDTLAYSCGIFPTAEASLRQASLAKFERVCQKLALQPSDRVLEIGAGWGGFALHAASNHGCHVTTTTVSQAQFTLAAERIRQAGLTARIDLRLQDYRDLSGQFDKLASIEMIEAVGHRYLDGYFRQCSRLLRPTGTLVIQAIVMPERHHAAYLRSVDFIQRYVFPGGCLPSLGSMLASVGRATDLCFASAEDFSPHYAETLRRWRRAFEQHLDEVRQLGYSERLIRLWRYYLCYCEAAFDERAVGLLQIQWDKPHYPGRELRHPTTETPRAIRVDAIQPSPCTAAVCHT